MLPSIYIYLHCFCASSELSSCCNQCFYCVCGNCRTSHLVPVVLLNKRVVGGYSWPNLQSCFSKPCFGGPSGHLPSGIALSIFFGSRFSGILRTHPSQLNCNFSMKSRRGFYDDGYIGIMYSIHYYCLKPFQVIDLNFVTKLLTYYKIKGLTKCSGTFRHCRSIKAL